MSQNQVTNSSPLIVLQRIGHIDLLPGILGRLLIPQAVRQEVFGQDPVPEWIEERTLAQPLAAQIGAARLGSGEREAIALALELRATLLLIDDLLFMIEDGGVAINNNLVVELGDTLLHLVGSPLGENLSGFVEDVAEAEDGAAAEFSERFETGFEFVGGVRRHVVLCALGRIIDCR